MNVYALIFEDGIESGYERLIGIYDSIQKAEETMEKDMNERCYSRRHYRIGEIELNRKVNITISEW